MDEIWEEICGNREIYLVSNCGNIKTKERIGSKGNIIKSHALTKYFNSNGYLRIGLTLPNTPRKNFFVHRLVAKLFVPNPDNKPHVNHIDGNKQNNHSDNLEWVTKSENERHAWRIGLKSSETIGTKGEKHGMHKLTKEEVDYIRAIHKPFDDLCGSKALAKQFNVSPQTITNVVHYANWK